MSGSRNTLSVWALRKLSTTDFSTVLNVEDLELQIRGLSRLAGLTYEEATKSIQRVWTASVAATRSHRSPGDASTNQAVSPGAAVPAAGRSSAAVGGAVEFLAAAGAGGGSPGDGFLTPRSGRRLDPFSTPSPAKPGLLGALPKEGPKGSCTGEKARGEFAAGQDPGRCRRNADRLAGKVLASARTERCWS